MFGTIGLLYIQGADKCNIIVHLSGVHIMIYIPVKLLFVIKCYFASSLHHDDLLVLLYLSLSPCLKMNFSTNAHCGSCTSKENVPPSGKTDAVQVQRAKQRAVLGVLSENEQRGRSLSQVSGRGAAERIQFCNFWFKFLSQNVHISTGNHIDSFVSTGKPIFQTQFDLRQLPAHLPWLSLQFQLWCVRRRGLWGCSCGFWPGSGLRQLLRRYRNCCPAKWRFETPAGAEFKSVWQIQKQPRSKAFSPYTLPTCCLLLQVHARMLLCSLNQMSPWCRRRCCVFLSMQRTFIGTWGRAKCEIIWTMGIILLHGSYEVLLLNLLEILHDNCFCF